MKIYEVKDYQEMSIHMISWLTGTTKAMWISAR